METSVILGPCLSKTSAFVVQVSVRAQSVQICSRLINGTRMIGLERHRFQCAMYECFKQCVYIKLAVTGHNVFRLNRINIYMADPFLTLEGAICIL